MPQSSAIFAFLAIAFLVQITMKGELRIYWGLLIGNTGSAGAPSAPAQALSSASDTSLNSALTSLNQSAQAQPASSIWKSSPNQISFWDAAKIGVQAAGGF